MSVYILRVENAKARAKAAWEESCSYLQEGKAVRWEVSELQPTRTLEQNAKFHAICGDLAKQKEWPPGSGKKRDTEGWKRLLVDAWARESQRRQAEIVPSLDGEGLVNLGIQTHRIKIVEMSELIEWAQAYCAENNVETGPVL